MPTLKLTRRPSSAHATAGMAEAGLAPRYFAHRHPQLGTPLRALMLQVVVIGVLTGLDFTVIMCVDNFFSAAAAALEFAAAVRLRASHPALARPFRIPFGTFGLAAFLLLPFGISVLVMWVTATHSALSLSLCGSATVLGAFLYLPWSWTSRLQVPDVTIIDEAGHCVVPIVPEGAAAMPSSVAAAAVGGSG